VARTAASAAHSLCACVRVAGGARARGCLALLGACEAVGASAPRRRERWHALLHLLRTCTCCVRTCDVRAAVLSLCGPRRPFAVLCSRPCATLACVVLPSS
jgi:hypothetical protein